MRAEGRKRGREDPARGPEGKRGSHRVVVGDGEGRGRRGREERGGRDKERPGARLRVTQLGNERIGQQRIARLCAAKAL